MFRCLLHKYIRNIIRTYSKRSRSMFSMIRNMTDVKSIFICIKGIKTSSNSSFIYFINLAGYLKN